MLIEHLLCSGKNAAREVGWSFLWVIFLGLVAAGIAGYAVYKYRIQVIYERPVKAFHYGSFVDDSGPVSNSVFVLLVPYYRGIWIRRSVLSWLSTCPWTTKEMSQIILVALRCEE
jgi:hypothetical protein